MLATLVALAVAAGGFQLTAPPIKLSLGDFTPAAECGKCHQEIYKQWSTSQHSKSLSDPIYRAVVEKVLEQTDGRLKVFCLSCHAPVASVSGTTLHLSTPLDWREFQGVAAEGVTCDFCHTISGKENLGKTISVAAYAYPRRGDQKVKYGRHDDGESMNHGVDASPFLIDSQFCATCHQFKHPLSLVEVQNTFDEWRKSSYYRKGMRCQDCHMPAYSGVTAEGGKPREEIHAHLFAGGHTEMLRKAATLDLTGTVTRPGVLTVKAVVTNSGAGHYFPTGVPGVREVWLDVVVTDSLGRRLEQKRFDLGLRLLGKDGSEAMPWESFEGVSDQRIPPDQSRVHEFEVRLPDNGASGPVSLEAKLNLRLVSQELGKRLNLPLPDPLLAAESKTLVPVR